MHLGCLEDVFSVDEYDGECETFEWGKLANLEVSDVVRSASVSSQGLVHHHMPISYFCFSACICIIDTLTACGVGGLEVQFCLV